MARILIVEDEEDLQEVLSYNLRQAGHEPTVVGTGQAGLERVATEPPDLVLLDLMLPDMSGTDVCRTLKSDPATSFIPIIGLSAHAMDGDRDKALKAGCNDYDTKPVELDRLLGKIEALLARPTP